MPQRSNAMADGCENAPAARGAPKPDHGAELGLVTCAGPDATAFLDAQSATALADFGPAEVRLCAFADPRGRVLATAYAWQRNARWHLALPGAEAEWLAGHLARFRFRLRVEIGVAAECRVAGVLGPIALADAGRRHVTGLARGEFAALDAERGLLAAPAAELRAALRELSAQAAAPEAWIRARLRAGEPEIRAATRGRFLPQMLGLDALGAVSFRKGCYPGQEVIARARNLGRVKRQPALLLVDAPAAPGAGTQVTGVRVEALDCVPDGAGRYLLQAVVPAPLPPALAAQLAPGSAVPSPPASSSPS